MNTSTQDKAIAILRLSLGIMFVAHGLLKIMVFTLPGTVAFFDSIGIPGFLAYVVVFAEVAGGAALILGYRTRQVALGLVPVLLGATWVHLGNGWVFSNPNGGWEYPLFLAIATIVLTMSGPGAWALRPEG
jgi:putative oxidoreductase